MLLNASFYDKMASALARDEDQILDEVEIQVFYAASNGCYSCMIDGETSDYLINNGYLKRLEDLGFNVMIAHVVGDAENHVELSW